MKYFKKLSALALAALIAIPTSSYAVGSGGYENATFSPKQIGRGFSGTAVAEEPAAISSNPSAINDLPGIQFQGSANFINMWTHIHSNQANRGSTDSSATTNVVPTMYLSVNPGNKLDLNNRLAFGVGIDSPFGLANKYDSGFTGTHYTGFRNWIKMYSIKPVVSFRLADWISLGGGPVWYRSFGVGQVAAYPNVGLASFGFVPATIGDGQIRADMSGNAWGWQLGTTIKPLPKHKLGFYFRSPAKLTLKGLAKGENIADAGGTTSTNGKFETGVHTKQDIPLNMTWGYNYEVNDKTDISADFGFTRWSSFDNLNIVADPISGTTLGGLSAAHDGLITSLFNTPGLGGASDKDWRNAYSFAVGGRHDFTEKFSMRTGALFWLTPVPKTHLTPVIPDSNRLAASVSGTYKVTPNLDFDLAYMGVFFLSRTTNNNISETLGTSVDGRYSSFLHICSAGLTYRWDGFKSSPNTEDWEGSTLSTDKRP